MPAKEELLELVDVLSEYECTHLLSCVRGATEGERFWEDDVGIFYNEYVKARYFNISRNLDTVIPAMPMAEDGMFMPISIVKSYSGAKRIELPEARPIDASVGSVLRRRRSRREYRPSPMSLTTVSTLLHHASGVTGMESGYDYARVPLRAFPSSGGMQAPEIYLSVQSVEGTEPGLYHYHALDHALELMKEGNHGSILRSIALGQPYVEGAPVVLVLTGFYQRLRWKYGERAYRYMCMDAGFLGENLYLVGESLLLGICAIAGFVDDAIEKLLDIDGRDEIALMLMTVGPQR